MNRSFFRSALLWLSIFLVFVCISYGYYSMFGIWSMAISLLISGIVGFIAFDFLSQSNENPNFNPVNSFFSHLFLTLIFAALSFLGNVNTLYSIFENNTFITEELTKKRDDLNKLRDDSKSALIGATILAKIAPVESLLNRLEDELTSPYNSGSGQKAQKILDEIEKIVGTIQRHPTFQQKTMEEMSSLAKRYRKEIMAQLELRPEFVEYRYYDKKKQADLIDAEVHGLARRVDDSIASFRAHPKEAIAPAQQVLEDIASAYSKIYSTVTTLAGKPPNQTPMLEIESREMTSIPHTFQRVMSRLGIVRTWVYIFIAILIDALPLLVAMATLGNNGKENFHNQKWGLQ